MLTKARNFLRKTIPANHQEQSEVSKDLPPFPLGNPERFQNYEENDYKNLLLELENKEKRFYFFGNTIIDWAEIDDNTKMEVLHARAQMLHQVTETPEQVLNYLNITNAEMKAAYTTAFEERVQLLESLSGKTFNYQPSELSTPTELDSYAQIITVNVMRAGIPLEMKLGPEKARKFQMDCYQTGYTLDLIQRQESIFSGFTNLDKSKSMSSEMYLQASADFLERAQKWEKEDTEELLRQSEEMADLIDRIFPFYKDDIIPFPQTFLDELSIPEMQNLISLCQQPRDIIPLTIASHSEQDIQAIITKTQNFLEQEQQKVVG